jgi:threonine synthase
MWRFYDVLPVDSPDQAISLGEGLTPLLTCCRRGVFREFENLLVKDESFNPTQSFKARGMSAAITRAAALGVQTVALPSAGNAAGAAAAYAARAGMKCVIFVPEDTPPANILESACGGAQVCLVNGLISDCGRLCRAACDRFGWFDLSTLKEPFRIEGKKTMGYELAFDLADLRKTSELQLPDVILYPTGGGTGLIGMWKAFDEMEALGWIGTKRPRMVVVQAEGCAPIVKAFRDGATSAPMFPNAHTIASGLRVPAAVGDFIMLDILRRSHGTALTVTDAELMQGVEELARVQGLFNTGAAVKYNHLLKCENAVRLDHTNPQCIDQLIDV